MLTYTHRETHAQSNMFTDRETQSGMLAHTDRHTHSQACLLTHTVRYAETQRHTDMLTDRHIHRYMQSDMLKHK